MPILNTIGDDIRRRRLALGLLQKDVAQLIGVDKTTVYNWEHNRSTPTLELFPKVIAFLGYNPAACEPKSLGEKVLQYRKSHGVSQKELAKQIGIDPSTLSRIERGNGKCLPSIVKRVSAFLSTQSAGVPKSQA